MPVVGPGTSITQDTSPESLLDKAGEFEYVTIFNPLSDDFQVRVAQDIPVNLPTQIKNPTGLIQTDQDVARSYGLNLKNPDYQAKKYVYNETIIPAGESRRFRGDMAQVALRQLVNELMQREGKGRFLADPTARREVEERLIKERGYVQDIMEGGMKSHIQQINETIDKSNEVNDEAFPDLKRTPSDQPPSETVESVPARRGRPPKVATQE